jgi:hypothetical protein
MQERHALVSAIAAITRLLGVGPRCWLRSESFAWGLERTRAQRKSRLERRHPLQIGGERMPGLRVVKLAT